MKNLNGIEAIKYIKEYFRNGEDGRCGTGETSRGGTGETSRGVTAEEAGALICYDIMSILRNSIKDEFKFDFEKRDKFEQIHDIIESKFDNLIDILKDSNVYINELEKKNGN